MITKGQLIQKLQRQLEIKVDTVQLMKIYRILFPNEDLVIHDLNKQTYKIRLRRP